MLKIIFSAVALMLSLNLVQAKSNSLTPNTAETKALKGSKLLLNSQTFVSHDKEGTDTETISNPGDYIEFSENGTAYMFYKGKLDSISYYFNENGQISFGDTPFTIKDLGNGSYALSQKEVEKNGDYNIVTYMLKMDNPDIISFKN